MTNEPDDPNETAGIHSPPADSPDAGVIGASDRPAGPLGAAGIARPR